MIKEGIRIDARKYTTSFVRILIFITLKVSFLSVPSLLYVIIQTFSALFKVKILRPKVINLNILYFHRPTLIFCTNSVNFLYLKLVNTC